MSKPPPRKRGGRSGQKPAPRRQPAASKAVSYQPSSHAQVVSAAESGQDLGHYLAEALPGRWSVRAVRRLLAAGAVTINGQLETFGSRRLKKAEVVDWQLPASDTPNDRFESKRLVFDDHGLVVYNKPPGLAVTPTEGGKQWHLLKLLSDALGSVHPVHRLDADTSGLVLFARSSVLAEEASTWFREHKVAKTYHAIVRGHLKEKGERRSYLVLQSQQPGFEKWGTGRGPEAREAITTWQVEEVLGGYACLVKVIPATGRHHQIRIHMSEMGHPLYGDRIYGDRRDPILCRRHMLHATSMRIPNPQGGKALSFRSRLPEDMNELSNELRKLKA